VTSDRIMQGATGSWASTVPLSAVELGIFSVLAAGPLDVETPRRRLGPSEHSAHDFFDVLVAAGLPERDDSGRYGNGSEAARFLAVTRFEF
jgi:hypothetical protein